MRKEGQNLFNFFDKGTIGNQNNSYLSIKAVFKSKLTTYLQISEAICSRKLIKLADFLLNLFSIFIIENKIVFLVFFPSNNTAIQNVIKSYVNKMSEGLTFAYVFL